MPSTAELNQSARETSSCEPKRNILLGQLDAVLDQMVAAGASAEPMQRQAILDSMTRLEGELAQILQMLERLGRLVDVLQTPAAAQCAASNCPPVAAVPAENS